MKNHSSAAPVRYCHVIGVKKEKLEEYKRIHAAVWPEVLEALKDANIHNYSIYLCKMNDDEYYLLSYFEYTGTDFEADQKKIADRPKVKEWGKLTETMQTPIKNREPKEWWARQPEVFHME